MKFSDKERKYKAVIAEFCHFYDDVVLHHCAQVSLMQNVQKSQGSLLGIFHTARRRDSLHVCQEVFEEKASSPWEQTVAVEGAKITFQLEDCAS